MNKKRLPVFLLTANLLLTVGCGGHPAVDSSGSKPASNITETQHGKTQSSTSVELTPVNQLYDNFADSYQAFTADLLKQLVQASKKGQLTAEDGVLISPASLYIALGMTAEGMAGDTLDQTLSLLHTGDAEALREGCRELLSLLSGNPKNSFRWANSLWLQDSFQEQILPDFLQRNQTYYSAEIVPHAFDATLIPAINRWAEKRTDGMIKELLQPQQLRDDSVLYLLNSLLFNGEWASPFDGRQSMDGIFRGSRGDVTLPMMRQTYKGRWMQDEVVSAALLDYKDDRTAMLIAVPREESGGVDALIESLDKETLSSWMQAMTEETIALVMPRFSMEFRSELEKILPDMGMKDAFDSERADFSRLTTIEPTYIGSVIHQTALQVGEEGTKAAAATAIGVLCGDAMNTRHVTANQPFLCAVVDKPTGALLFAAVVTDPKPIA